MKAVGNHLMFAQMPGRAAEKDFVYLNVQLAHVLFLIQLMAKYIQYNVVFVIQGSYVIQVLAV